MNISPEDAARSLADARAVQAQALRAEPSFPTWFTTGVGLFATGIAFVTEPGTPPAVIVPALVVLTGVLVAMVLRLARGARLRVHRSVIEREAMLGYTGWVLASVAVAFAVAFPLAGAGVRYAGGYGCLAMTAFMAATGPFVARWISRRLAARAESR
ncbi:hypothetical protein FHS43_004843 [Streptosporangium becharense]|uniref:Transmembrane protein n=1 Tax=Streptosporangium becharense TaxID=1816182 RepID=A0A7W9IJK7_9ACTN|nr:hypothetical protein [Streptosporangium becharense]MBB2913539.1 hypothetical protein [Streptosporangium becharense]MBB5821229.1 hypothetical protein [Streptosporangium becharense]